MCGIAGSVGALDPEEVKWVERQLRTMDHRGPDSWGMHEGRGAVIGQTRLAVIDLFTGDPPITNEDRSIGAVLNGEIYNYQSIRERLMGGGHRLATEGDTEVLAHLSEELDAVALARLLRGMFSFATWDDNRQRLVIGRDRLGKKPLYYWLGEGRLVFGSEIKAVLAHPAVPRRLAAHAIPAYLTFGYVPTPRTFFEGISSLPPGHVLVKEGEDEPRIVSYWQAEVPGPGRVDRLDMTLEEAGAEVRSRLTRAVQDRLIADVPLGAFLSGGIDSSTVVGLMAEVSDKPVKTFTIGFEDTEGFDERPYARTVAERFSTEHVEFVVAPDAVDLVERLVWHYDQPFGDSSAIPTFLLSRLTRKHVTVALCGDGGDELFAGYERFTAALAVDRYGLLLAPLRLPLGGALSAVPASWARGRAGSFQRFLGRAALGLPDALQAWVSFLSPEWRARLVGEDQNWGTDDYRRLWDELDGVDTLDRLLALNLRTYLLDDLLPKVDRMAMAHALEVRSPFLDHELVEFALRLPRHTRVKGLSRKRALKAAVGDLLPREILHRRKRGFGVPLDRWFRAELGSYLTARLGVPDARVRAHVSGDALDDLIAEHQRGEANHGQALWTLLTLEVFLRRENF